MASQELWKSLIEKLGLLAAIPQGRNQGLLMIPIGQTYWKLEGTGSIERAQTKMENIKRRSRQTNQGF